MNNSSMREMVEHNFHRSAAHATTATEEAYDFTWCEHRHWDEIIDLLAPLWGPVRSVREDYFDWKYCQNPYVGTPLIYLTLYKGLVIGTDSYAVSCWTAGAGQERYLCLQGADGVVSPEHRRRGLHYKMQLIAQADLEGGRYHSAITLGANFLTVGSHHKAGGKSTTEMSSLYCRPGNNGNSFRAFARKLPVIPSIYHLLSERGTPARPSEAASGTHFCTLDANYERNGLGAPHMVLKDSPEPEAMAALVSRDVSRGRITQVRDEAFFAWRYRNPLSVFRFVFREKAGLQGYLVLRQPLYTSGSDVFIVDWEAESAAIFSEMLEAVTGHGGFASIGIWSTTMPDDRLKVLRKHGFIPTNGTGPMGPDFRPHLMVMPLNTGNGYTMGGRNLLNAAEWDLRPIFADTY